MKKFPVLFKYTSKGQIQQWQIVVDGDSFYTIEGISGGKLTKSEPTVCQAKNVGRANETTAKEQALREAAAKHKKKLDANYNEILTTEKKFFSPMLAKKLTDLSKDEIKRCIEIGAYIQPKLDGLRAISQDYALTSRNGKPFVSTPHLHQGSYILDGELYSHDLHEDFNEIVSLCKKQNPTIEDLQRTKLIEYHAYDFPEHDGCFSERYAALKKAVKDLKNPKIILVETIKLVSPGDIEELHGQFLEAGYEGSIIRFDLNSYESGKRSSQCLKHKDFIEEEFKIVDILEGIGNRASTAGKVICALKDGRTFGAGIKGNRDYFAALLQNKKRYIGKTASIKYFRLTPDGIPRFGVAVKIARESYE